ncbi:uncharacterized protein HMPREF1541_02066 [Cyphellophora europaea CBS 101466]|uniref:RPA43 OB domain-containing protein n=1 Tax=Cyphellophora europaea (strain CBS 101466) TaxID=1220924 RepID=W2S4E4_CYPE1|nr:uncharacterized protein HMPREF1541_02066 [Cyphellophora europaea CBS 101466]ETN42908.1 hypothetical protein HMPREF1541_02066 [Cyphellophora europaea CBS 101466]
MSVQLGNSTPHTLPDTPSSSKSKKRKHEGKDERSSDKKKRKHDRATQSTDATAAPALEVEDSHSSSKTPKKRKGKETPSAAKDEEASAAVATHNAAAAEAVNEAEDAARTPRTEKQKRKSKKDKSISLEETPVKDSTHNATEDEPASEFATPHQEVESQSRSNKKDKKEKKKKKSKSKDTTEHTSDEPSVVTANGIAAAPVLAGDNSDIELLDAPPLSTATPVTSTDIPSDTITVLDPDLLSSIKPSPFYSTRLSLLLSLPAIAHSPSSALSSLLATHITPLLLNYFAPARGVVLAFSDPVLSARAGDGLGAPLTTPSATSAAVRNVHNAYDVLAKTADEFGASWAWLTVTLLVFCPEHNDELAGWANVVSEGFVGVIAYNYFQAGIGKARVPKGWQWMGATGSQHQRKKAKKGRLGDGVVPSQDNDADDPPASMQSGPVYGTRTDDDAGYFVDEKGEKVPDVLKFRVVDTDMAPAHEASGGSSWSLQIDGTLLDEEAEQRLLEEEKDKFERQQQSRGRSRAAAAGGDAVMMSGGLARSRHGSVMSSIAGGP